jgi:hypothetical protein
VTKNISKKKSSIHPGLIQDVTYGILKKDLRSTVWQLIKALVVAHVQRQATLLALETRFVP